MNIRRGFVLVVNLCEWAPFWATLFASARVSMKALPHGCGVLSLFAPSYSARAVLAEVAPGVVQPAF